MNSSIHIIIFSYMCHLPQIIRIIKLNIHMWIMSKESEIFFFFQKNRMNKKGISLENIGRGVAAPAYAVPVSQYSIGNICLVYS